MSLTPHHLVPEKLDSIYRSWNPFIVVGHCADIHKNDFKENAQEFFVLFFPWLLLSLHVFVVLLNTEFNPARTWQYSTGNGVQTKLLLCFRRVLLLGVCMIDGTAVIVILCDIMLVSCDGQGSVVQ